MSTPEHPLPWRWTDHNGDALLDGDGRVMLVLANAGPVAPRVRAVTERSGAMEALLRNLMTDPDENAQRVLDLELGTDFTNAVRALLAEIDAIDAAEKTTR